VLINYWTALLAIGCIIATIAYTVAWRIRIMALVDVVWTAGLGIAAISYLIHMTEPTVRSYTIVTVLVIWSARLSIHLIRNRVFTGKEDPRYAYLTAHWGQHARRNYYPLFLLQVLLITLFMVPVSIALSATEPPWGLYDWLGITIAVTALAGESMADRQLTTFRADPSNKDQVCQLGWWRYSRHPNYFFEWLHWWAYVAFAVYSPLWVFTVIGPISIYLFLRFITGVPHAERSSLRSRGAVYQRYQQTTNTFFPWKPHPLAPHQTT
jgi:steroid 5-alpha reductase family enzyme